MVLNFVMPWCTEMCTKQTWSSNILTKIQRQAVFTHFSQCSLISSRISWSRIMRQITRVRRQWESGWNCEIHGRRKTIWLACETTQEWRPCRSFPKLERSTRKVRVWITQIPLQGSWWKNWFFTFCTNSDVFSDLEFLKSALFVSAFFWLFSLIIREFGWFRTPQNSRIFRLSETGSEYASNANFSIFRSPQIWLSRLLGFNILDFEL